MDNNDNNNANNDSESGTHSMLNAILQGVREKDAEIEYLKETNSTQQQQIEELNEKIKQLTTASNTGDNNDSTVHNPIKKFRNIVSKNPFTGQLKQEFPFISDEDLLKKIEKAHEAYENNKKLSKAEKAQRLLKLASLIEENTQKYAELITSEMGKPITATLAEVKKAAGHCRYYAEHLDKYLNPVVVNTEAKKSTIELEPIGVIYNMVPFNFPFWLVFKSCISAIVLGNTVIHRNADTTPLCGLAAEELFKQAGYNSGEFQNVFTSPAQTELILSNKHIQGVSFTGSTVAGRAIATIAGKYGKKCVMELGGSDPFVVLKDADIDQAAELAATSRLQNCGQVCFSGKRFIVEEPIYHEFKEKLIQKVKDYKIGDPMQSTTQLGPMARTDLVDNIDKQLNKSIEQGGNLVYGGGKGEGNFYNPAIVEVKDENNVLAKEETFGPVFCLMKAQDEKDLVRIANNTEYGLGAVVCSKNIEKAEEIAKQIESGLVFINAVVKSDSRLPSGGVKGSGYGRECGDFGVKEFANIRTVWIG